MRRYRPEGFSPEGEATHTPLPTFAADAVNETIATLLYESTCTLAQFCRVTGLPFDYTVRAGLLRRFAQEHPAIAMDMGQAMDILLELHSDLITTNTSTRA
jgi:hypothetical protein